MRKPTGGVKTEALNLENYGKDLYLLKHLINSTFFQP